MPRRAPVTPVDVAASRNPGAKTEASDGLQTLHRALTILELFTPTHEEWTASEVSSSLELSLATASRFMRGLEARGYLIRTSARGYRLGFAAVDLGHRATRSIPLRSFARPVAMRLAATSQETSVVLTMGKNAQTATVVDAVMSRSDVHLYVEVGQSLPLHAGLAKTLLAWEPEEEWRTVAKLSRRKSLVGELAEIRERGWCGSFEGIEAGTWGIGAPVFSSADTVAAVIGIIAPLARHSAKIQKRDVEFVLAAAEELREQIAS